MYNGEYSFFDYKYNIVGYTGQDYGGIAQTIYSISSLVLIITLLFFLRKLSKEKVLKIIRFFAIFFLLFLITKTVWESYYDIKYTGHFNYGLLPLDLCSIPITAFFLAGFTNGKIKDYALSWIVTGEVVGGIGVMFYLTALNYYPFFTFGAFYSMLWHFLMVFLALLIVVTNYIKLNYKVVIKGFIFHLIFSIPVIIINYIYNFDFMFYNELSSIPVFDEIGTKLINNNLGFINPIIMTILYFIAFNIAYLLCKLVKKIYN